jgi:UDP-N-acetylglucosamine 4,6-dehydratase
MAVDNVDIIIHAAAVKNIEISEFNPIQTVETNINGIINMIKTVSITKPKKFINISTDKSVDASTLYGTTKQLGERLISWAGMNIEKTKFASVRFGNVIETKGNVFEIWEKEAKAGLALSITNPKMKRYFFHIDDAVDFILKCLLITNKGEIFVPKMKSFNIKQLADKISKKQKIIGLRQGEKMDEILISEAEKDLAKEYSDMWRIQHYSS